MNLSKFIKKWIKLIKTKLKIKNIMCVLIFMFLFGVIFCSSENINNVKKPQFITIVNFIRGWKPENSNINLLETLKNQLEILDKRHLTATFLIQYDALVNPDFTKLLNRYSNIIEIGAWFEIVKPLVEDAGMKWRGDKKNQWQSGAWIDFSIGYTPNEKRRLADTYMKNFRQVFGIYPQSVGSWIIDSTMLDYLKKKYNVSAAVICREQYGTDGYNLWGGGNSYYPSRKNIFMPAQTEDMQIKVPVFRMLGPDPIYQYDAGLEYIKGIYSHMESQPTYTLETIYPETGSSDNWIHWFFKENFNGLCLSFGFAQAGQENSFGWQSISNGYIKQIDYISEEANQSKVQATTLHNLGEWYSSKYKITPATAIVALTDWKNEGRQSVWYYDKYYRVNFSREGNSFRVRDIHKFDERYMDRYLSQICQSERFYYNTLPIFEGNLWSGGHTLAGIRFYNKINFRMEELKFTNMTISEIDNSTLSILLNSITGDFEIICSEQNILFKFVTKELKSDWGLEMDWDEGRNFKGMPFKNIRTTSIDYHYDGYSYPFQLDNGSIKYTKGQNKIYFENVSNCVSFDLGKKKLYIDNLFYYIKLWLFGIFDSAEHFYKGLIQ